MASGKYCFGIDLGTSNSSICYINPNGRHSKPYLHVGAVKLPVDSNGRDLSSRFPSMLCIDRNRIRVGFEALKFWNRGRISQTIFASAKSDLGAHRFYENAESERLDDPVKVQSELLRHLAEQAKKTTNVDPREAHAVITVPASFEASQRADTLRAAALAGFSLSDGDLLDEPNAAFLDLANTQSIDDFELSRSKNILVFDFGGGTCDVSVVRVKKDEFSGPLGLHIENLAISHYERLGGDNIDLLIVETVFLPAVLAKSKVDVDLLSERDKRDLRWHLRREAKRLKERLCSKKMEANEVRDRKATINQFWTVEPFELPSVKKRTTKADGHLSFEDFEEIMEPFLMELDGRRAIADGLYATSLFIPVQEALDRGGLKAGDIDVVVLNGGSCRNPLVHNAFKTATSFATAKITSVGDPDLAVAQGAAVHCFYKHIEGYEPIAPIVSSELGLLTYGNHYECLVEGGSRLPYPKEGQFKQFYEHFQVPQDNLSRVQFAIYAGRTSNRKHVQTLTLELPKGTEKGEEVMVELRIDANKTMHFKAFLATQSTRFLESKLENPLAMRIPTFKERTALEYRERIFNKRRSNHRYSPSPEECIRLSNLERDAGKPERALDILQGIEDKLGRVGKPLLASFHDSLARSYSRLQQDGRALEHYKQAMTINPSNDCYVANYGLKLCQAGQPQEAFPYLRRAISLSPHDGTYYLFLAEALRQGGDEKGAQVELGEARKHLERALYHNPKDEDLLRRYSSVLRGMGEYKEAAEKLELARIIRRSEDIQANFAELVGGSDSGTVSDQELGLKGGENGH